MLLTLLLTGFENPVCRNTGGFDNTREELGMTITVTYNYFGIHITANQQLTVFDSIVDTDPSDSPFYWGQTPPASVTYYLNGNDMIFTTGVFNNILHGQLGDDWIVTTGGNDQLYGGAGDDELAGGGGSDEIFGGSGSDGINGGDGDDILFGGVDDDSLSGGIGNDALDGGTGNDELEGGDGDDVIKGAAGDDSLIGSAGNDSIEGGLGHDRIDGGEGDDIRLSGGGGDDEVFGGNGNDKVDGGAGNDYLDGGAGNDELRGGPGFDEVVGGAGADKLYSGPDAEAFIFEGLGESTVALVGRDTIYGFQHGVDYIDAQVDAIAATAAYDTFTFIGSGPFTATGQIRVVTSGADVRVEFNTTGTLGADMAVLVKADVVGNFTAADFNLV